MHHYKHEKKWIEDPHPVRVRGPMAFMLAAIAALLAAGALVVLGSAAALAASVTNELGCSIPDKLTVNVAAAAVTVIAVPLLFVPPILGAGVGWIKPIRTRSPWPVAGLAVPFVGLWAAALAQAYWTPADVCRVCPSKTLIVLGGTCYDCVDRVAGAADVELCRGNENVTRSRTEQRFHFYQVAQGFGMIELIGFVALAIAAAITVVQIVPKLREEKIRRNNSRNYRPARYYRPDHLGPGYYQPW